MEQISLSYCSQIMMIMIRRRQDMVSFFWVISKVTLIVSALVVAGCDAVQDPPPAPVAHKPVVFNPSISMSEFKPGQFIRVTERPPTGQHHAGILDGNPRGHSAGV